jgi:hypothetical protein
MGMTMTAIEAYSDEDLMQSWMVYWRLMSADHTEEQGRHFAALDDERERRSLRMPGDIYLEALDIVMGDWC